MQAECQCRGSWGKSIKCIVVSKLEGILTTWTGAIRAAPVARFHQGGGFRPGGSPLVARTTLWICSFAFVVVNSNLRQAIPQRVAREPEQTRGLRLIPPCALQRFADHFVFPLVEGHAVGEEAIGRSVVAIARRVELDVADFQLAALGERA